MAKPVNEKIEGKTISFNEIKKQNDLKKTGDIVKRIFISSMLCLLALIVIIVLYQNRYDLTYNGFISWVGDRVAINGKGDGFPVNIKGNSTNGLSQFNGTVVSLTDTTISSYNESGKSVSERQHGYGFPVLETGGRYAILYDMGSKSYRIESISRIVYNGKRENRITVADIGESGNYAIAELNGDNTTVITLFERNGIELIQRTTDEYRPLDLSVSPDGSSIACVGIKSENGDMVSVIEVIADNPEGDPKQIYYTTETGNMLVSVEFLSNDMIMVVGDTSASVIEIGKKKKTDYTYSGRSLSAFDVQYSVGGVIMLSDYKDRKECSMLVFGKNGLKVSETPTGKRAVMVSRDSRYVCFAGDNKVYKYKVNGDFVEEYSIDTDVNGLCIIEGDIYVCGSSTIQKIEK